MTHTTRNWETNRSVPLKAKATVRANHIGLANDPVPELQMDEKMHQCWKPTMALHLIYMINTCSYIAVQSKPFMAININSHR